MSAPSAVTQLLCRAGLIDPSETDRYRAGTRHCHPLTVLGDHSPYALGIAARTWG
ncbi:hypothetical protein ACQW02_09685 [Humitalea sp. 24SJ18S-53]|uniref:hypothetical protein n=1 Tax=Humitalea sp. 24SJ18S-53 TaxID=3422307 RepID=UPI003D6741FE